MEKKIVLMPYVDRVDLLIERDNGNEILILMGKGKENWIKLARRCEDAIQLLDDLAE